MKTYGVRSAVSKKYCWVYQAKNKRDARRKLRQKIGNDSLKYRREMRVVKDGSTYDQLNKDAYEKFVRNHRMSFGKYYGKKFSEVPTDYLQRFVDNAFDNRENRKQRAIDELEFRKKARIEFSNTNLKQNAKTELENQSVGAV